MSKFIAMLVAVSVFMCVGPTRSDAGARRTCGSTTAKISYGTVTVRQVKTFLMSCKAGRRQIRRFYRVVLGNPNIPVAGYDCGQTGHRLYCASGEKSVSWRQGKIESSRVASASHTYGRVTRLEGTGCRSRTRCRSGLRRREPGRRRGPRHQGCWSRDLS